jgi:hypothetical protein
MRIKHEDIEGGDAPGKLKTIEETGTIEDVALNTLSSLYKKVEKKEFTKQDVEQWEAFDPDLITKWEKDEILSKKIDEIRASATILNLN